MASLHKENGDRQGYKIRWRDSRKRQRAIWQGKVSKKSAATYLRHISELIDAQGDNRNPKRKHGYGQSRSTAGFAAS